MFGMFGPHPIWTIVIIGSVLFLIWYLEKLPFKPMTASQKIKMAAKMQSMNIWCLFVSAYADAYGSARAELNAEQIKATFDGYNNRRNETFIIPDWMSAFIEETIDPKQLRPENRESEKIKNDQKSPEEIRALYRKAIIVDIERRALAKKIKSS